MATLLLAGLVACGSEAGSQLTRDELLDPQTCATCHPDHYREWSGSMHAYAGDDPIFLAMNERGQEETGGELGDFCVRCHAPMALVEGVTVDGLNLDEVDRPLKGVTCYFCHNAASVEGTHNNPIEIANDDVLRASLRDAKSPVHRTGYSELLDTTNFASSALCGSCHDIVTPAGVHLERTYAEYQESIFSKPFGAVATTCSTCHMFTEEGPIADIAGAPSSRQRHTHGFPGVDVALTSWPDKDVQRQLIQRDLDATISPRLCVNPGAGGIDVDYILDNVNAGHAWPSGASADRRAWANVIVYEGDTPVYDSGSIAEGDPVADAAPGDPDLWQLRDFALKDDGVELAHMFWDVREVLAQVLPPAVTTDPEDPNFFHAVTRRYSVLGVVPTRVTAQLYIRPVGLEIVDDLVASGHLDPAIRAELPTFELAGAALEWSIDDGYGCVPK